MRLNSVLMAELEKVAAQHKKAFIPPSGPAGPPMPQGAPQGSPYQQPGAVEAAAGPGGAMPMPPMPPGGGGMPPPGAGAAPPGAPPAPGGAPPGGDLIDQLGPLIDQRIQAMQATQGGGEGGAGGGASKPKGSGKVDGDAIMKELTILRKLVTQRMAQDGTPMPHDILDTDEELQQSAAAPGAAPAPKG